MSETREELDRKKRAAALLLLIQLHDNEMNDGNGNDNGAKVNTPKAFSYC